MKVLIVKTSSMGDVIHLLPALTDASKAIPQLSFDWLVEKAFAEIPSWHATVRKVIPISLRLWLRNPSVAWKGKEWQRFYQELRIEHYDYVIDAQGLIKSAFLTRLAHGLRCGLDWSSARESLASLAYQRHYKVNFQQHAVIRMRQLLSLALNYATPIDQPDYGLTKQTFQNQSLTELPSHYLLFIHGSSANNKLWPEDHWVALANQANAAGYPIYLPWGNEQEQQRAQRIAAQAPMTHVLPKASLGQLAALLAKAKGAIAVDTGLGHLSAALNVPTVSLYLATDPMQIGTVGLRQKHLCVKAAAANQLSTQRLQTIPFLPQSIYCEKILPNQVWQALTALWGE